MFFINVKAVSLLTLKLSALTFHLLPRKKKVKKRMKLYNDFHVSK